MSLQLDGHIINPHYQNLSSLRAEVDEDPKALHKVADPHYIDGSCDPEELAEEYPDLENELSTRFQDVADDLEKYMTRESFADSVTRHLRKDKSKDPEADAEEQAAAKRVANNLYALSALMARLNEILTSLQAESTQMYYSLREPQRQAYEEQKKAHTIKAFVTLGAGILGGGSQIIGAGFGATGQAIGKALGEIFPSIGNCVSTLQEGQIQGENAYRIRSIEADMQQDQTKMGNIDQLTMRAWQTFQAIHREISQTSHTAASQA